MEGKAKGEGYEGEIICTESEWGNESLRFPLSHPTEDLSREV